MGLITMRTPAITARAISYSPSPGALEDLVVKNGVQYAGWDFDGTIADTERFHRVVCRAAVNELCGHAIPDRAWNSDLFRNAFNRPADDTNVYLARGLKKLNSEWFQDALVAALHLVVGKDSMATVASAISLKRADITAFFHANVSLTDPGTRGARLSVKIPTHVTASSKVDSDRLELLQTLAVHTYPYVKETIESLASLGIRQGVATSSDEPTVKPFLKHFKLLEHFQGLVFAGCVPNGLHKPEPYPWRRLKALLANTNPSSLGLPSTDDMIHFENSSGGGLSALRAGKGLTVIKADNQSATMGKLQRSIGELHKNRPGQEVSGTALFVPCFSKFHTTY